MPTKKIISKKKVVARKQNAKKEHSLTKAFGILESIEMKGYDIKKALNRE